MIGFAIRCLTSWLRRRFGARGRIRTDRVRIKGPVQFLVCFARVLVRERGVEPRHDGAKTRRRPGWLLPIDWSPRRESNSRSCASETHALPLSYGEMVPGERLELP